MGFPWRQILGVGKTISNIFLPGIVSEAIDRIEDTVIAFKAEGKTGWASVEKQQKALELILDGIVVAEGIAKKDLLDNPTVDAAGRRAIDAMVSSKKALAEFKATVELVKSAKAKTQ